MRLVLQGVVGRRLRGKRRIIINVGFCLCWSDDGVVIRVSLMMMRVDLIFSGIFLLLNRFSNRFILRVELDFIAVLRVRLS